MNDYLIEECTYGGRVGPRVGSGQTICRQSRVGSGQRFAGSGRVGPKRNDPWTTLVIDIKCIKKFLVELKCTIIVG